MKLIVGLGNPGFKYEKTRHNMGFMALDKFFKQYSKGVADWKNNLKFKSEISEIEWQKQSHQGSGQNPERVFLVRPQTYMNNSGLAVSLIANFYKIKPEDIWILHDDIDLPSGALKIRFGGASAGHRGVESIITTLGVDKFWRFRMGIGHPVNKLKFNPSAPSIELRTSSLRARSQKLRIGNVDEYVLREFERGEMGKGRELIKRTMKAIEEALEKGMQSAMNRYNSK